MEGYIVLMDWKTHYGKDINSLLTDPYMFNAIHIKFPAKILILAKR